jgi:hypothetical protein
VSQRAVGRDERCAARRDVRQVAELKQRGVHRVEVIALVRAEVLELFVGVGARDGDACQCCFSESVASVSRKSGTFAPAATTASGMPRPSANMLRLLPRLPRSTGLGPVSFSPQRRFGRRRIETLPEPVESFEAVVLQERQLVELREHTRFPPLLEAPVRG